MLDWTQALGEGRGTRLPLSRRASLAGDAFVADEAIMLMNSLMMGRQPGSASERTVASAMKLTKALQGGNDYLNQRSTRLMLAPDAADTVECMRAREPRHIVEYMETALAVLQKVQEMLRAGVVIGDESIDKKSMENTRYFFRMVHDSIFDQFAADDAPMTSMM